MNPKTRQSLTLSVISLFFVLAGQTAQAQATGPISHQISLPSGMSWCDDSMINGLFTQINVFRSQNGATPLSMSALSMKDAEMRATQFATYVTTTPPGSPGIDPHQGYHTTAASLGYNFVSEDLAFASFDPAQIVNSIWQDSLHIAAMLAGNANVAGVSCIYYNATVYWTYEPGACTGTACGTPALTQTQTQVPTLDSEDWAFLTLINNFRTGSGVGALQVSVDLQNASQWMSNDMATNNYVSHTDSLGRSAGARLAAFGYPYSPWGENIAAGYPDAQSNFNAWLTACDPDDTGACTYAHRSNMLGAGYNVIGIAHAYNDASTYGWYWTTDFGGYVDQIISPNPTSTPMVVSFAASPSSIKAGQTATLSWNVTGATTVTINNGVGTVSSVASSAVSPTQTTTYTMTAANSAGSSTASVTVTLTLTFVNIADSPYQVKYAANLSVGDSYFDIQNTGANGDPSLGPGVLSGLNTAVGNLCANVYTIDPNEELISCCSCLITPGQSVSLTALTDLAGASNTATGTAPPSISVKLIASLAGTGGSGTSCANSAALVTTMSTTFPLATNGMAAWGTTLHPGSGSGPFVTTETEFTAATLSTAELTSLTGGCAAIIGNISGHGQCTSCSPGALGAQKLGH